MNVQWRVSDDGTTEVRASLQPTTGYVATTEIDCRGYTQIDFFVKVDTVSTITKVTVLPESGQKLTSGTIEYSTYLAEVVASGVSTTNQYVVELNDPTAVDGTVYKVSLPVEGRYVRLRIKADAAAGAVSAYANRRVS